MDEIPSELDPIEQPKKFPKNKLARAAAKAAAGAVPFAGSTLAELADAFVPDHEAIDRSRWEGNVTEDVNHLHSRIDDIDERTGNEAFTLQGTPALVAKFMIERCTDGLANDRVTVIDLQNAYPNLCRDELLDALGDLESIGLMESRPLIGAPARYRLTQSGYEALDKPILGWDTENDARSIAALVVKKRENIRSAELEAELGWSRRRFNPALRMVVDFVDPGRVSGEIQPDYVTRSFSPNNAELAYLRRFAAGQ